MVTTQESGRADSESKAGLLWQIFSVFFRIGAFTFGGGYAMLPLIKGDVVERNHWLEEGEFIDIIGVAQVSPGAVAINSAIFIGYKLAGFVGSVSAALGVVLPSFIVILLIATVFVRFQDAAGVKAFFMGVRPAVTAMIAAAAYKMGKTTIKNWFGAALAAGAFAAQYFFGIHPILALMAGGIAGYTYSRAVPPAEKGR